MVFDWKTTSEYTIEKDPQELYETIMPRFAESDLEVRRSELTQDSFRIVAALKSKSAYALSYEGKHSSIFSEIAEMRCQDKKMIIMARNSVAVSLIQIWCVLHLAFLEFMFIVTQKTWIELLLPVLFASAICGFALYRARKCYREAVRCALGTVPPKEKG